MFSMLHCRIVSSQRLLSDLFDKADGLTSVPVCALCRGDGRGMWGGVEGVWEGMWGGEVWRRQGRVANVWGGEAGLGRRHCTISGCVI